MSPELHHRQAGKPEPPSEPTVPQWLVALAFSCLITALLWPALFQGGGLIGGDIYPYFLPQKQLLADEFAAGRLPLWHDRTALGYPLLAESQAAVFYPPTQLLYRLTDPHTAFHVSFLLHYILAGLFSWRFFRSQRLSQPAALLASLIYVCSWFPARASLEWSIIGGVWLPLTLWLAERLLQRPSIGRLGLLATAHALHLLAGHFTLAFINQLMLAGFGFWRGISEKIASESQPADRASGRRPFALLLMVSAIALSILLAAVQLVPTMELRLLSQRSGSQSVFNPAYGHMPPLYTTQLIASWWYWHSPEILQSRKILQTPLAATADTNAVEAHFYVGLIPLGLCLCLLSSRIRRTLPRSTAGFWLLTTTASTVYAFGWLVPFFRHLPGFGFFMGPGRYTILGTLALSLLAGLVLDALLRRSHWIRRWTVFAGVAACTFADLQWSTVTVSDAVAVVNPPWLHVRDSWISRVLRVADSIAPVRLYAPGPNVGNLFGISCVPQYLGLCPAAYLREDFLPTSVATADQPWPDPALDESLQKLAVTHLLTMDPVPLLSDEWELEAAAPDAFLNRAWARGNEPCYLYNRRRPPARVQLLPPDAGAVRVLERQPGRWVVEVTAKSEATVQIADLPYAGWKGVVKSQSPNLAVSIGQKDADSRKFLELPQSPFHRFLKVPSGRSMVTWQYEPASFHLGATISATTLLMVAAAGVARRRLR
jgi:hypothetical protein